VCALVFIRLPTRLNRVRSGSRPAHFRFDIASTPMNPDANPSAKRVHTSDNRIRCDLQWISVDLASLRPIIITVKRQRTHNFSATRCNPHYQSTSIAATHHMICTRCIRICGSHRKSQSCSQQRTKVIVRNCQCKKVQTIGLHANRSMQQ
jgi:hypothetical protein